MYHFIIEYGWFCLVMFVTITITEKGRVSMCYKRIIHVDKIAKHAKNVLAISSNSQPGAGSAELCVALFRYAMFMIS